MSKLTIEDIKTESLLTHLNILSSDEDTAYELRVCFTLKTGEVVRITIGKNGAVAVMDYCVRKSSGDFLTHLMYDFTPGIFHRYLNKTFSECIKDITGKQKFDNTDVIDLINKIRKNYLDCTPILKLG